MDPRNYLTVARELAACMPVEYRRSAVNRSYYAAYGVAHQALESLSCPIPQTAGSHLLVRDILTGSGDPSLKHAGGLLNQLYAWRIKADYRYDNPLSEERRTCNDCVRLAESVIRRIDAAMGDRESARLAVHWTFAASMIEPFLHIGRLLILAEAVAMLLEPLLAVGRDLGVR